MSKHTNIMKFALCVNNTDCEDIEKRKIYRVIPDEESEKEGLFRIVDESGDDYLYPQSCFILISLPLEAQEAFQVVM